jgi:RNA polymerase sigma factor (sigma-70 family)
VLRNSGTKADARDLFQDTLVVLWQQSAREGFVLTSSLNTYLMGISRNLWLKQLARAKRNSATGMKNLAEATGPGFAPEWECPLEEEQTLSRRIFRWLSGITLHCRTLLENLFLRGRSYQELGYKNKHTAQNQQYKCLQQLRRQATGSSEKE